MSELSWGRRYLLCPPSHFGVLYEINPWMNREVTVDRDAAQSQWESLRGALVAAGAEVELLAPAAAVPDLVFTANAGVVNGRQFVASRFRHEERRGETALDVAWFSERGFEVSALPEDVCQEG
ncbi:MAG TPA: hypothetical protein VGR90_02640, partial [Acidimicrobiales bacterium]|nr:hypothetical protein [Acidimicrobiales bacterium]